jgi:hypothetical protein
MSTITNNLFVYGNEDKNTGKISILIISRLFFKKNIDHTFTLQLWHIVFSSAQM